MASPNASCYAALRLPLLDCRYLKLLVCVVDPVLMLPFIVLFGLPIVAPPAWSTFLGGRPVPKVVWGMALPWPVNYRPFISLELALTYSL